MKKLYVSILLLAILMGGAIQPAHASAQWSATTIQLLARSIVNGQRPPLSAAELAQLDAQTKQQLLAALATERAANRQPSSPADKLPEASTAKPPAPTDLPAQVNDDEDQENYPAASLTASQAEFIKQLAPLAQAAGQAHDLYPSVLLAQAALESNWGRSSLGRQHHNLFGIKGGRGIPSVSLPTQEEQGARLLGQQAWFRTYPNWQAAVDDYASVLSQPLYAAVHRRYCPTYRDATRALAGKYATDSHYDRKLNAIIQSYHLDKYDQATTENKSPAVVHHQTASHPQPSQQHQVTKQAVPVKAAHKQAAWAWPVLGGCGSVGLWQLIRRRWF